MWATHVDWRDVGEACILKSQCFSICAFTVFEGISCLGDVHHSENLVWVAEFHLKGRAATTPLYRGCFRCRSSWVQLCIDVLLKKTPPLTYPFAPYSCTLFKYLQIGLLNLFEGQNALISEKGILLWEMAAPEINLVTNLVTIHLVTINLVIGLAGGVCAPNTNSHCKTVFCWKSVQQYHVP